MNKVKKSILITGANGLLGRHTIKALEARYDVHAVVHQQPEAPVSGVTYHIIDLASEWSSTMLPAKMDIVFHLAQSSKFRDFPDQALDVFKVNVDATAKLLDYAKNANVQKFVFASSGGVYGSGSNEFHENSPITAHGKLGYYLCSKLCGEVLTQNYSQLMDVTVLRLFFMYGSGQRRSMLIPRLIDNVRNGVPITLQGEEGIRINPIHVSDAVKALEAVIDLNGSHTFNVAGPETLSIKEIADKIGQDLGQKPVFEYADTQPSSLVANIETMREFLIAPQVQFTAGLKEYLTNNDN